MLSAKTRVCFEQPLSIVAVLVIVVLLLASRDIALCACYVTGGDWGMYV